MAVWHGRHFTRARPAKRVANASLAFACLGAGVVDRTSTSRCRCLLLTLFLRAHGEAMPGPLLPLVFRLPCPSIPA